DSRRASVDRKGLLPHLDHVRDERERAQHLQQPGGVVGHGSPLDAVQVHDCRFRTWETRVVEPVHLVHRARQTSLPPFRLGRQAPGARVRLEVRELPRQQSGAHLAAANACWCSRTQSATVLWKCRTRISWSFSGKSVNARASSPICVPSSVPASCSAYSLTVTAAYSRAKRSRAVVAGTKPRAPSNTGGFGGGGQKPEPRDQPGSETTMCRLGKIW